MNFANVKTAAPEFDKEAGLEYVGGDEDFFIEMLGEYVGSGLYDALCADFDAADWANYEIHVHTLKSSSRMMGFPELGNMCEKLQNAAGSKDAAYIQSAHEPMMERYAVILAVLGDELN